MSKEQAKIREGLSRIVRDINAGIFDIPVESKGSPQTIAEFEADSLLSYLDKEGAVLLVERELPSAFNINVDVISALEYKKKLAGWCAVEPLIEAKGGEVFRKEGE